MAASEQQDADVLIVGSGPVGMAMAMDFDQRGISCIVVERRAFQELPSVKCNHVAARTMESFRRLGVASLLRNAGLPEDFEHSVAFRTTVTGPELVACTSFRRATSDSPTAPARTGGGPHPSCHTASIRSTWSRCCRRT